MHMADALLSPAVGGTLWAASAAVIACSSKKIRHDLDDRKIPLMGVIGAFVFAAQMINFTIPGTGSSGHIGGGLLLAVLLGPHAALLTIASVLTVQALFFADGGLLALGSNIFNLGVLPCFLAYPLVYRPIAGDNSSPARLTAASLLAAVVGLQFGALGVVFQTTLSGLSELPFTSFALLMQPVHLAIGIVEGLVTAAVLSFLRNVQPEILTSPGVGRHASASPLKKVMVALLLATALTGGILSWFASERPDGLDWSIARASGSEVVHGPRSEVHRSLEQVRQGTAMLPDYALRDDGAPAEVGTSLSGLVGGAATLVLTGVFAVALQEPSLLNFHPPGEPGKPRSTISLTLVQFRTRGPRGMGPGKTLPDTHQPSLFGTATHGPCQPVKYRHARRRRRHFLLSFCCRLDKKEGVWRDETRRFSLFNSPHSSPVNNPRWNAIMVQNYRKNR